MSIKIESVKNFIKAELSGWSKLEKIAIPLLIFIIVSSSVYAHDARLVTIQAVFGLMATTVSGKGKISCYFFGIVSVILYSFISWRNTLYGSFLLHVGYYLPMQFWGLYEWSKHLKSDSKEIYKRKLSNKARFIIGIIAIAVSIAVGMMLKHSNDQFPFIDSFVLIFAVVALSLAVKRYFEQWICWTVANALSVIMWFNIFQERGGVLAILIVWFTYFWLGIYFLFQWKKEIESYKLTGENTND